MKYIIVLEDGETWQELGQVYLMPVSDQDLELLGNGGHAPYHLETWSQRTPIAVPRLVTVVREREE